MLLKTLSNQFKRQNQSMANIGKLTTFSRLIAEESVIMIPKVQRDYAYGRNEEKVREVLTGMLDTMFSAVKNDRSELFDFVYGGSYAKKNNKTSGMIPLDGQQRLTTLFLLHFYASLVETGVSEEAVSCLKKFRYETRQSATDFCESLVGEIRQSLIPDYTNSQVGLKALVVDHPKYLPAYDSDPTIQSMLNVLEIIERKHKEYGIENLWTALTTRDNIQFYALSLDKFDMSDDLYIKMNSRGKKLTEFEIFKSDFVKRIKGISTTLKDQVSIKLDNDWMDILWEYANVDPTTEDKVKKADNGFMRLLKNIFRIEMFIRGLENKVNRQPDFNEIITDESSIKSVVSIMDVLSEINQTEGLGNYWDKYFYFSSEVVGKEDKIRLFWRQEQSQKPVFYLAMERDLSVPEIVYFYSLYHIRKNKKDDEATKKSLRIIRNLVTANVRANSARYDMLSGFIKDALEVIDNDGIQTGKEHTFLSTTCDEEYSKAISFSADDYGKLLKYENHDILQGSVMLFIDKYRPSGSDSTDLFSKLSHFEAVFHNNYDFNSIRIGLVNQDIEYMQYEPSMENEAPLTRRLFIHCNSDFSQFFIKNERRRNQFAILSALETLSPNPDMLLSPSEKSKEFAIDSWKYYMVKYQSSNRSDTRYGCYAWDDKENHPLELVILNSSYHSIYNIEWKMLNHILASELWDDNDKYSLDYHASSPFVMNKYGITMTITQSGWQIQCNNPEIIDAISQNELYSVNAITSDDSSPSNTYLADFKLQQTELDYIDLAKRIINDIEKNGQVALTLF